MKKYNLSKIMKRAWELVKGFGLCISEGLKKAWKEAKSVMNGSKKQVAWAQDIIANAYKAIEEIEGYPQAEYKEIAKILREKIDKNVETQKDAAYWIERRSAYTRTFIRFEIGNKLLRKMGSKYMLG